MISATGISVLVIVALCVIQKTKARQNAAFVYMLFCGLHYIFFDGRMDGALWPLYYVSAGLFSLFVIIGLHRLKDYTEFHQNLQKIAFVSILINFLGGAIQFANGSMVAYQALASALYLVLIWELLRDGRNIRIPKDGGVFRHLFRNPV